jgi:branched-chain amino acid transport system ATP-binding protein
MNVLEIVKVTKRFGGLVAVSSLDLEVKEGAIQSVIGPNGAGKTTLFNCITGFYMPEEGEMLLDGKPIAGLSPDRVTKRGISRTFQNIRLFKNMTAVENVLVGMHAHLHSRLLTAIVRTKGNVEEEKRALEETRRLLGFVNLRGKGDLLAKNLSYGDQRRLEIARALASKPRVLLLDEPTAGMNPSETQDTTNLIRRLRDELGITILLIEHQMRVVMGISEKVTVMDFGLKIAEGTPLEIQASPQVIEAYLGRGAAAGLERPAEQAMSEAGLSQ